jgi:hypothetical protein
VYYIGKGEVKLRSLYILEKVQGNTAYWQYRGSYAYFLKDGLRPKVIPKLEACTIEILDCAIGLVVGTDAFQKAQDLMEAKIKVEAPEAFYLPEDMDRMSRIIHRIGEDSEQLAY